MNIIEIIPWLVLGFAPTLISMEAAWRMGKIIGKRGEKYNHHQRELRR
jgi:hypothetical protein